MSLKQQTAAPQLFSVPEVAERAGVSTRYIWQRIADGDLPTIRLGTRVLVAPDDLAEFVNSRRTRGKPTMPPNSSDRGDAAEIAPQVVAALRCWMSGDRAGWAKIVNESRFPVRTFASVLFNVVAKFATEADDPEQFLDLVGELVVRD